MLQPSEGQTSGLNTRPGEGWPSVERLKVLFFNAFKDLRSFKTLLTHHKSFDLGNLTIFVLGFLSSEIEEKF